MIKRFNHKLNLPMIIIHPGEYYVTGRDEVVATLLGSCVSVCLEDQKNRMGGMNHFMLPGSIGHRDVSRTPKARYGSYAMEMILGELIKMGCSRQDLTAKVFGGGHVLNAIPEDAHSVPQANIDFALGFLSAEGIRVTKSDLGGRVGRQVLFLPHSGKVYLRRLEDETNRRLAARDRSFQGRLGRRPDR